MTLLTNISDLSLTNILYENVEIFPFVQLDILHRSQPWNRCVAVQLSVQNCDTH